MNGGMFSPVTVVENSDAVVQQQVEEHYQWISECAPGAGSLCRDYTLRTLRAIWLRDSDTAVIPRSGWRHRRGSGSDDEMGACRP